MLNIFKKIWAIYRPLHGAMFGIFVLMIITNLLDLAWPYIYGKAINSAIEGVGFAATLKLLAVALGILALQNIVGCFQAILELNKFHYESSSYVHKLTLRKLFSLSIGQHRNEHSGLTQSVVSDGQNSLRELVNLFMYNVLPNVLKVVFAICALSFLSWKLGLVVIAGLLVAVIISYFQNHHFTPFVRKERQMSQELGKKSSEMIRNAPLVISNTSEVYAEELIGAEFEKKDSFGKAFWKKYNAISYLLRGMTLDITLVASIGVAAHLLSRGELGPGQIVTVILWSSAALSNLGYITTIQRQILLASEKIRKYLGVLELPSDIAVSPNIVSPEKIEGKIEFKHVSFAYPKKRIVEEEKGINVGVVKAGGIKTVEDGSEQVANKDALVDVSFALTPGEHVAFVGASGAGKSTTILLLLRGSDPQSGSISIDDIDLREIDLIKYRSSLGVVEQSIVLFDDTVRKNISFGLPEGRLLTDDELDRLAKISRIDEFKDKLVNGWDTLIGENGIKLSGGQRQRVGIARALAKDPSILILDEATSSLDAKNEALIKDALHDAAKGRTTIMIAHRLSTVKDADRIFVFDKGGIVGVGKHAELLETCPTYKDLVSHQTVLL